MDIKKGIFLYFVLLVLVTGYLMCTLWLAQPKVEQQTATPDDCKSATAPLLTRLDPDKVAIGENYTGIVIHGCHFKSDPKLAVQFDGEPRTFTVVDDDRILVQLSAADFASPKQIKVSVETSAAPPATPPAPNASGAGAGVGGGAAGGGTGGGSGGAGGQTPSKVQSNTLILNIQNSADILVTWRLSWPVGDVPITLELRLILLILFTGAFAASIGSLKSLVDFVGSDTFKPSWDLFYFGGPLIGGGVALIFYFVIRGGFLAGTNVDIKTVNPYGLVAVAALVGMFWDAAAKKLNDVFENLFQPKEPDKRPGGIAGGSASAPPAPPAPAPPAPAPPAPAAPAPPAPPPPPGVK